MTMVERWTEALKHWAWWLLGEEPLPDRAAQVILAGTTAVVVLLIAFGAAISSTTTPSTNVQGSAQGDLSSQSSITGPAADLPIVTPSSPSSSTTIASPTTTTTKPPTKTATASSRGSHPKREATEVKLAVRRAARTRH